MEINKKRYQSYYKIIILFAFSLIAQVFFNIPHVSSAPGDIQITVRREADNFRLSGATVEVRCTDGSFSELDGAPLTDVNGVVEAAPNPASDCPNGAFPAEPIEIRVTKTGYIVKEVSGLTYNGNNSPNEYAVSNVQFKLKVITADELGNPIVPTLVEYNAEAPTLVDPDNSHIFYWETDRDSTLNIEKDGYVSASTTNGNFNFITMIESVQIAITMGDEAPCNSMEQISTAVSCKGLEFGHKANIIDELGNPLAVDSATSGEGQVADCQVEGSAIYCPTPIAADLPGYGFNLYRDGYVQRPGDEVPEASNRAANTDPQVVTDLTTLMGMRFAYKLTALTSETLLTNITASATTVEVGDNTGRNACSLSGGAWYCPVVLANSNGNLIARVVVDGYVEALLPLTNAVNRMAAHDEQLSDTVVGIQYAVKAAVTNGSGATVTAGDGFAISCTENAATGIYFCPIPLAHTATTVAATKTGYINSNGVFVDRIFATDAQRVLSFGLTAVSSGGGGGGFISGGATGFATTPPATNSTTPTSPEPAKTDIVSRIKSEAELIFSQSNPLEFYLNTGTESTFKLGKGERGASVSSFTEASGRNPASLADWNDVLNIANGRWPIGVVKTVEARAYTNFRLVYGRNADMKNSTDVNALKMMGYGVMYNGTRDLTIERFAISRFIRIFGFSPAIARHWNIIRAIAYSGVNE